MSRTPLLDRPGGDTDGPRVPVRRGTRRAEQAALSRLAGRTFRTNGWRTVLIAVLIGIAVAVATVAAIHIRSTEVPVNAWNLQQFGQADLLVQRWAEDVRFETLPPELRHYVVERLGPQPVRQDEPVDVVEAVRTVLPEASVTTVASGWTVVDGDPVEIVALDPGDPLTAGVVHTDVDDLDAGQALASAELLGRLDAGIGDTIEFPGVEPVEVVGPATDGIRADRALLVLPEGTTVPQQAGGHHMRWLVGAPGVDRDDAIAIQALLTPNRPGVAPGGVNQARPAQPVSPSFDVELRRDQAGDAPEPLGRRLASEPSFIGSLIGSLMLVQVAFVAAAAFATGTRRRLREFGLLGATGAAPQQIRGLVVREALVLGAIGATGGALLGLGVAIEGRPVMQELSGVLVETVDVHPLDLLGPAALGVLAALAAAILPARTLGRVPTVTALAGRLPARPVPRWLAPAAVAASTVGFGFLLLVVRLPSGYGFSRDVLLALGAVTAVAGAAALGVPLISLAARFADRLPVTWRLAIRDADRQRSRSAAAVAALVVVLAVPVLVMTATSSRDSRLALPDYEPNLIGVSGPWFAGLQLPPTDAMLDQAIELLPTDVAQTERLTMLDRPGDDYGGVEVALPVPDGPGVRTVGVRPGLLTPGVLDILGIDDVTEVGDRTAVLLDSAYRYTVGPNAPDEPFTAVLRPQSPPDTLGIETTVVPVTPRRYVYDLPELLLPAALAVDLGLEEAGQTVLLRTQRPLTSPEAHRLQLLDQGPSGMSLSVFDSSQPNLALELGIVLGLSLLVALIVVGLVTALAATESDRDLGVVTAVGGEPALRRRFHGAQSAFHTFLAATVAIPTAILLYVAVQPPGPHATTPAQIPWVWLPLILLGIPALVGLTMRLLMRPSRIRLSRRVA